MAEKFIKDEMLFTNKKVFGDNEEHEYNVKCYDGYAMAEPTENELKNFPNAPKLRLIYPKLDELSDNKKIEVLEYRGLYDEPAEKCNYADVCMRYGKIVK